MADSPYSPAPNPPVDHQGYRTAPLQMDRMPPGIPYIIGNEAAERFSFYGMRGILYVFMTQYITNAFGELDLMTPAQANVAYHTFVSSVYFLPLLGGFLADYLWGKYLTIIRLSLIYCLGHAVLGLLDPAARGWMPPGFAEWFTPRVCLYLGLGMIALGSGGIKPCVSSHVGDQFGSMNRHLVQRAFTWFYFSVNFGAFFSQALTPELLARFGPGWAFGVPGVLMFLATIVFWLGRHQYAHIPPKGPTFFQEIARDREGKRAIGRLAVIYLFVAMFWCLFDQTSSVWVEQAKHMDRVINLSWLNRLAPDVIPAAYELRPAQMQAVNPILILILIPLFSFAIYPAINSIFPLTPLRKIGLGLFLTTGSFAISAIIETWIQAGHVPHMNWQVLAYIVLTAAEVMVSITCLEFSYTQAPKSMKSIVMSVYYLSVTLGNLSTAVVNKLIQDEAGQPRLTGANYHWFFTGAMFVTACIFVPFAMRYRGKTYLQDE